MSDAIDGRGTIVLSPRRAAAAVVAFGGIVALVVSLVRWIAWDDAVWRAVLSWRGCDTDAVVEHAVRYATAALAALLVTALALHVRFHGVRPAWAWLVTWLLGLLASKTLKHVFTRDRPSALPDFTTGYSFPSAHVMNGIVAALAVMALAAAFRRRAWWRASAAFAATIMIVGRVLLGRHWASDVLGGIASAVVLVALVPPAVARRPLAASLLLAGLGGAVLAVDHRLGSGGWRLPSPLVGREAALVDVDVGPEMSAPRRGGWSDPGLERPFGSYVWLEGEASLSFDVDADRARAPGARLAVAGRPRKDRGSCAYVDVTLNGRRLGHFVPFVGWREYRFAIPDGILRAGANELAIAARGSRGPARFAVTYVRVAADRSAAAE